MRFNVTEQIDQLWQSADGMGAEQRTQEQKVEGLENQSAGALAIPDFSFNDALMLGVEVNLADLTLNSGLFSFRHYPVLFIAATERQSNSGKAIAHLKGCRQLKGSESGRAFAYLRKESVEICPHCLYELNYLGFYYADRDRRLQIQQYFDFISFVAEYGSSYFVDERASKGAAIGLFGQPHRLIDWQLSRGTNVETISANQCIHCEVEISGTGFPAYCSETLMGAAANTPVKQDACLDCYKKIYSHAGIMAPYWAIEQVNRQRRSQGLFAAEDWQVLKQYSDPAHYGLLDHLQRHLNNPPRLYYPLFVSNDAVESSPRYLLYAWPEIGKGITPFASQWQQDTDWSLWSLEEAISAFIE